MVSCPPPCAPHGVLFTTNHDHINDLKLKSLKYTQTLSLTLHVPLSIPLTLALNPPRTLTLTVGTPYLQWYPFSARLLELISEGL